MSRGTDTDVPGSVTTSKGSVTINSSTMRAKPRCWNVARAFGPASGKSSRRGRRGAAGAVPGTGAGDDGDEDDGDGGRGGDGSIDGSVGAGGGKHDRAISADRTASRRIAPGAAAALTPRRRPGPPPAPGARGGSPPCRAPAGPRGGARARTENNPGGG